MKLNNRLRMMWRFSIIVGAAAFLASLLWINSSQGPGLDWIWIIAAFGAAVIVYNVTFFALCSIFTPSLATLVEDDTEVHGDDVTHVVRHVETGNEALDSYVRAYAGARGVSAVAIVSGIMIAIALTFF